jgi:hypothetical protein
VRVWPPLLEVVELVDSNREAPIYPFRHHSRSCQVATVADDDDACSARLLSSFVSPGDGRRHELFVTTHCTTVGIEIKRGLERPDP